MVSLIGQSIGRYHILEQLGEGGMATVYKAYGTRLERDVAVKVIRTDQFAPAVLERILKRFEREAKTMARLTHPNIVGVIDYGDYKSTPYLVMPYLPGGTLKQRLGKPLLWQEAVHMLLPIASALQFAHQQGIIHRDIKPSNILITVSGQPMLSDFGIAKILEGENSATMTGTGMGVGTPEYMAPEQWTGEAGHQADIYALGVVLYELVTGHKPYTADTPAAILLKQATQPLPRPTQYAPSLPEAMERFLIKSLAKKTEDRYPDMAAMAHALEGLLGGIDRINVSVAVFPIHEIEKIKDIRFTAQDEDTQATIVDEDTQVIYKQESTRNEQDPASVWIHEEKPSPPTQGAMVSNPKHRNSFPWLAGLSSVGAILIIFFLVLFLLGGVGTQTQPTATQSQPTATLFLSNTATKISTIHPTFTSTNASFSQPSFIFTPTPIATPESIKFTIENIKSESSGMLDYVLIFFEFDDSCRVIPPGETIEIILFKGTYNMGIVRNNHAGCSYWGNTIIEHRITSSSNGIRYCVKDYDFYPCP